MDDPRLDFGHGICNFIFFNAQSRSGVCKPPTRWIPWLKTPGRETGVSPPSSADVKKSGAIYLILLQMFMARAETKILNVFARRRTSFSTWLHYWLRTACSQHPLHKHTLLFCRTKYPVIPMFERTTPDGDMIARGVLAVTFQRNDARMAVWSHLSCLVYLSDTRCIGAQQGLLGSSDGCQPDVIVIEVTI